jgi:hypothetical protein
MIYFLTDPKSSATEPFITKKDCEADGVEDLADLAESASAESADGVEDLADLAESASAESAESASEDGVEDLADLAESVDRA